MIGNKQKALEYIESLKDEDIVEITKKQQKSVRSLAQNRYWHGVICKTIGDRKGETNVEIHYMLKTMFNLETTTDLSTDEFAFMCNAVIDLFKVNYNVRIPLPREDENLRNLEKYLF